MHLAQHSTHRFLHRPGNLGLIEITHTLRNIAINFVSLFIPIYLLELGFSLREVLLFFAAKYVAALIMTPVAVWLSTRYKITNVMMLSIPLNILYFIGIYSNPSSFAVLAMVAALSGAEVAFYWFGFHIEFSKDSNSAKMGKEVSLVRTLLELTKTTTPLVGGFILFYTNFETLIGVASLFLVLAAFPLYLHSPDRAKIKLSGWKKIKKVFPPNYLIAETAFSIQQSLSIVIWPLYIYLFIIQDYIGLGAITSGSFLVTIAIMLIAGHLFDKNRSTIKIGSFFTGLINVARIFAEVVSHAVGINVINGVISELVITPYTAKLNNKAKENLEPAEFFLIYNVLSLIVKSLVFVLMAILPVYQFETFFVIAALSTLAFIRL